MATIADYFASQGLAPADYARVRSTLLTRELPNLEYALLRELSIAYPRYVAPQDLYVRLGLGEQGYAALRAAASSLREDLQGLPLFLRGTPARGYAIVVQKH